MFRELRKQNRKMDESSARELLEKGEYGFLATVGGEGYPYAVPLSYVYEEKTNGIYFHCAREGHKLDNIAFNKKVSFSMVSTAQTLPDQFAVNYESVIAFGQMTEIDEEEKREALVAFLTKYSNDFMEKGLKYLKADEANCRVFKLTIEHLSGKERRS